MEKLETPVAIKTKTTNFFVQNQKTNNRKNGQNHETENPNTPLLLITQFLCKPPTVLDTLLMYFGDVLIS